MFQTKLFLVKNKIPFNNLYNEEIIIYENKNNQGILLKNNNDYQLIYKSKLYYFTDLKKLHEKLFTIYKPNFRNLWGFL